MQLVHETARVRNVLDPNRIQVRARELRRFTYTRETVDMIRDLKIGVKDSVGDTFRAHFLWDVGAKRIAFEHCGKHLDHD